ncbi:MAG: IS256 family transposase [Planctomycetota bacterium]
MKLTSLDFTDKDTVKQFIQEHDIRDIAQLNSLLRQISGVFIEQLLEAERDEHLGYERYQQTPEPKANARNGYSKKKVRSVHGKVDLDIPRDRIGTFEPTVVKKHQRDISELEDKVISMYAKGMTVRDIQSHLCDIYGAEISPQSISNLTAKVSPLVEEWRSRPLQSVYAIVYIDGIRYKVRADGRILAVRRRSPLLIRIIRRG